MKIIAESPHSWQKIVIHGNSCIILYIFGILSQGISNDESVVDRLILSNGCLTHCGTLVIWRYRSRSTLVEANACYLTVASHNLNQCWLLISQVLWHSPDGKFTTNVQAAILYNNFRSYRFKISVDSPMGQWGKIHYDDVAMIVMASQITSRWIVCFTLFKLTSKKTSKVRDTSPLWGKFTGDRWIFLTKGH